MQLFLETIADLIAESGLAHLRLENIAMIVIAFVFMFLAIKKGFEPLLLLPIAFGMLLTNLPMTGMYHAELWNLDSGHELDFGRVLHEGGLLDILYMGVKLQISPSLIFLGIGCKNIKILGPGTIDMQSVWDEDNIRDIVHRGAKCIALKECHNIVIEGITVLNATDLAIYFAGCYHVEIRDCKLKVYIDGISPDNIQPCFHALGTVKDSNHSQENDHGPVNQLGPAQKEVIGKNHDKAHD